MQPGSGETVKRGGCSFVGLGKCGEGPQSAGSGLSSYNLISSHSNPRRYHRPQFSEEETGSLGGLGLAWIHTARSLWSRACTRSPCLCCSQCATWQHSRDPGDNHGSPFGCHLLSLFLHQTAHFCRDSFLRLSALFFFNSSPEDMFIDF